MRRIDFTFPRKKVGTGASAAEDPTLSISLDPSGSAEFVAPKKNVSFQVKDGDLEIPGVVGPHVFRDEDGSQVLVLTAPDPGDALACKIGFDGHREYVHFGEGCAEVLSTVEGAVEAAITQRTRPLPQLPAGAAVVVPVLGQEKLLKIGGVVIEPPPEISDEVWKNKEREILNKILTDPIGEYGKMRTRLEEGGLKAAFPEFEPVVQRLLISLRQLGAKDEVQNNEPLMRQRQIAMTRLVEVAMRFRIDFPNYPYDPPFDAPYPYKPTLDAIRSAIEVLDGFATIDNAQAPNPLYHADRYQYYWDPITLDPTVIAFPTMCSLGFSDFIKTRAANIGFLGVADRTLFVDRHQQSPLDFFIHDVNHVRRMWEYSKGALRSRGVSNREEEFATYAEWQKFIDDKLMPLTSLKGKTGEENLMAHLVRLIVFEILHESAVEPTPEALLRTLNRKPGAPDPFEHMLPPGAGEIPLDEHTIEDLRTAVGNLHTGAMELGYPPGSITVRYFMDRAVVLLGNVMNKAAHGFYDPYDDPKGYVAPPESRTPQNVAKAAQVLYAALGVEVDFSDLLARATSVLGSEELFQEYPLGRGIPDELH